MEEVCRTVRRISCFSSRSFDRNMRGDEDPNHLDCFFNPYKGSGIKSPTNLSFIW